MHLHLMTRYRNQCALQMYIIAYLLKLELDGGLQLLDLADHVVTVGDHGGELTGLVQTGSQNTRNLEMTRFLIDHLFLLLFFVYMNE